VPGWAASLCRPFGLHSLRPDARGLPIGLQIVGAIGADALVLRASRAFEQARPFGALQEPRVR
jgi:Asp-tRNA(Asn)/Glu-tRNA(Gln) amidotransferase A subunit family amidase